LTGGKVTESGVSEPELNAPETKADAFVGS